MNLNYFKRFFQAPVRPDHGITRKRKLFFVLPLLVCGMAMNVTNVLAATSGNLTTVSVANVGPATVYAGAQNVAILSFTIQVKPAGVNDTFRDALVQFTGDNTADLASVQLYRESGTVPGTFNAATDTLLATDTTASSGEYDLDPSNFSLNTGTVAQFYVVANFSAGAVDGHKIDFKILADKIALNSGTWPSSSEVTAGTWDPAGFSIFRIPTLSIGNAAVTEGNSGTANATFSVSLSEASAQAVTVNFATANGTATAPADYASQNGILTFTAGQTNKQITVLVNGDATDEIDESFTVTLSSPINASIATAVGTGTIQDDDAPPTVSFASAASSGSEATTAVTLPVFLSAVSAKTVTVDYSVSGGTATGGGVDFTLSGGTLTFAPGVTNQNINITVVNDTLDEDDETLSIDLSNPSNGTLGTATHTYTILDNDPIPSLSINNVSVTEGNSGTTNANFTVTLSAASSKTVSVNYATADGSATAPADYAALPTTTLTFN